MATSLCLLNHPAIIAPVALPFHGIGACPVVSVWIAQLDPSGAYRPHCLKPLLVFLVKDEPYLVWIALGAEILYSRRMVRHWHTPEFVSISMIFFDELYQSTITGCKFTKSSKTILFFSRSDSALYSSQNLSWHSSKILILFVYGFQIPSLRILFFISSAHELYASYDSVFCSSA